ncbi:MAG: HD domain-containing protein [Flavobacteriaceae bacterium]|nr:HD domain-containing protein [Flavobacteriaceae bacterium]
MQIYTNKRKIFNDPVLGFISISSDLIFDLIEHSYFQRLRRISQTGLSCYVYAGATHTRFLHVLGCMHLMQMTFKVLRDKGAEISKEEEQAALIAILLHDIGHSPFSHALEAVLLDGVSHEKISLVLMNLLNEEFNGELSLAIKIFLNQYDRKFFHQLIAGQLDLDRLDYLKRDSFFTGVSEGNVNSERIITMMNVVNDELVIDGKGIYSIEKYLTSRMFMYWQVYFHKTSVAAELYLVEAIKRAKELVDKGIRLPSSENLQYFLQKKNPSLDKNEMDLFTQLDDADLISALKIWQNSEDRILSLLSRAIIQRKLPLSVIVSEPISEKNLQRATSETEKLYGIENGKYFVHQKKLEVLAYDYKNNPIKLLLKKNKIVNLQEVENQVFINYLKQKMERFHVCAPKELYTLFQRFL